MNTKNLMIRNLINGGTWATNHRWPGRSHRFPQEKNYSYSFRICKNEVINLKKHDTNQK